MVIFNASADVVRTFSFSLYVIYMSAVMRTLFIYYRSNIRTPLLWCTIVTHGMAYGEIIWITIERAGNGFSTFTVYNLVLFFISVFALGYFSRMLGLDPDMRHPRRAGARVATHDPLATGHLDLPLAERKDNGNGKSTDISTDS
jgi:hypothetical protein